MKQTKKIAIKIVSRMYEISNVGQHRSIYTVLNLYHILNYTICTMCMDIIAVQCLSTSIASCSKVFLYITSFTLSHSSLSSLFVPSFPSYLSPLIPFLPSFSLYPSFFSYLSIPSNLSISSYSSFSSSPYFPSIHFFLACFLPV